MNHDSAALVGRSPGLGLLIGAAHLGIITRLQFRIAIEVSQRRKIALSLWSVTGLHNVRHDSNDVDDRRHCRPCPSMNALDPLDEKPPLGNADSDQHSSKKKRNTDPIVS